MFHLYIQLYNFKIQELGTKFLKRTDQIELVRETQDNKLTK